MDRVRVLHVHTLPVVSGSGINTLLTMVGMDRERYQVEFACAPGGALIDEVNKADIPFFPITHFVQQVNPYHDLMALWQLVQLIKKRKYHIEHGHNSKAGFIARLAAKIAGVPIIIHTIHGFAFHDSETTFRQKLFIFLEKIAAPWADKLIVISSPLREWGLHLKIGKPEQYVKIYSGIEIEKFRMPVDILEKRKEWGLEPDDRVIGLVSKLWDGKGHKDVLKAVKNVIQDFGPVKLMFVGEGYLKEELEQLAKDLGIQEHVIFTGFRCDIAALNAIFDIATLASSFEGMGRVLLEAMALGKPVVATRVGGIVDVVDEGETGILVQHGNVAEITQALITLLKDESLRQKMGQAGKEKIDANFSAQTMVSQINQVYEEILVKKGL